VPRREDNSIHHEAQRTYLLQNGRLFVPFVLFVVSNIPGCSAGARS
jgi:hypothetical protein